MTRAGPAIIVAVWLACGGGAVAPRADEPIRLREVASIVEPNGLTLLIETTAPVAYVTSNPDSSTLLLDLRGATAEKASVRFVASADAPVRSVKVEDRKDAEGRLIARVRIGIGDDARYRIRSARSIIRVEFDRGAGQAAAAAVRTAQRPEGVVVLDAMAALRNVATGYVRTTTADGETRIVPVNAGAGVSTAPAGVPATATDPVAAARAGLPASGTPASSAAAQAPAPAASPASRVVSPTIVLDPIVERVPEERVAAAMPQQQPPPIPLPAPPPPPPALPQIPPPVPEPQPVPASLQTQVGQGGPAAQRQFTGDPMSIDLVDAPVRDVLRSLALEHGLNIVLDPGVTGNITLTVTSVPWDQIMDIIMRSSKLDWIAEGNVVRIAPIAVLQTEQNDRRALAEAQAQSGALIMRLYTLSYAKAEVLRSTITSGRIISLRGTVEIDPRTNTLIVTDLPQYLAAVEVLIATLDKAEPQVEIEARIVQTTREFARSVGVQWGFTGRVAPELGNTTPLAFPNRGSLGGRTGANQAPQDPRAGSFESAGTVVNLPVTGASSALGIALGAVNGAANLDIALSALERTGQGRILSTPRVVAQNNTQAEITQGIQIPIQVVSNNSITLNFKDAALKLLVTPQITASGTVIMTIDLENSTPDFSRQVNGIPPIDTQRARSTMMVADGETGVVGGIFVSREQTSRDRTPGLHSIPLLGWLFKREAIGDESRELLIFLTPRIVR